MSTRSTISKVSVDGTVKSIYCHWDGYPSHNGQKLIDTYNMNEKVDELIALGSLSSLKDKIAPAEGIEHSFDVPQKDVTVAYHRDRDEDLDIREFEDLESLVADSESHEEFNYVFIDSKWFVFPEGGDMVELTQELIDSDDE